MIAERFPDHEVLGEEFGGRSGSRGDPARLLGVRSDRRHDQLRARAADFLLVARARNRRASRSSAAVYDPSRKELFTAERGQGARLNGQPIRVSSANALIDSLLVTGFHYDVQKDPGEVITLFGTFISQARAVRRLGSAALDLCYVAAGRFDGFWEKKLQPWDIAGGALIVMEAGGRVTTMTGAAVRVARRKRAGDQRPDP